MIEKDFWKFISAIDTGKLRQGQEHAALVPLEKKLAKCSVAQLFAFEEYLSRTLYAIDGAEFADNAGESGGSGDGFLYARCYVVAMGREFYEAVKLNPNLMPKSIDQWCEPLMYCHLSAWAKLTGLDQSDWPYVASVSYESFSNQEAWPHLLGQPR